MANRELQKVYNVFQLIRLLDPQNPKSVRQLEGTLGVSNSQVHRYIQLLKDLGYPIKTTAKSRKYIEFVSNNKDNTLDSDEWQCIHDLLMQNQGTRPLANSILQKLDRQLSLIPLADALPGLHRNRILQLLRLAMDQGLCVRIIGYRSIASNTISNRLVEPLEITLDYKYLIAWDKDKEGQRQFKIDRIEDIEVLEECFIQSQHLPSPMDIFGLTGEQWMDVRLELGENAHHLLIEEFPQSQAFIRNFKQKIYFDGRVRNWKGIGRFVLGLSDEITVLHPPEFKSFLRKKIQKSTLSQHTGTLHPNFVDEDGAKIKKTE